jgi:PAS domain S-box-containing protein
MGNSDKTSEEAIQSAALFPEQNPSPVMRVARDGTLLYANPAGAPLLACWNCRTGQPVPDNIHKTVLKALESNAVTETDMACGKIIYSFSVVPIAKQGYVNLYGRDATASRRFEKSLWENEKWLNKTQEIAHLGSWELDLMNNRLSWSDEAYRIFGLKPQEFTATYEAFLEAVHPDDRVAVDAAYSGSLREDKDTYEIEHRVVRKSTGQVRIVHEKCEHIRDESGKVIRSVGMVHDITARKQAEELIRKSELKFRTIFDSAPCGIFIVDRDRRVKAVNQVMEKTFNVSGATVIDKRGGEILNCIHSFETPEGCGYAEACRQCVVKLTALQALDGREKPRNKAKMQLLADGNVQERTLLVSAAPVEYEGAPHAVIIMEDITEVNELRRRLKAEQSFSGIIGQDPKMLELYDAVRELAESNAPVLIQGESGTGKELVASAVHNEGPRAGKQFVPVNCGALPDGLLESELFGHVKGAFTGAIRDKKGRFELADGGTIFLDEIGDLSPAMQVKLLRVLQAGSFERVGDEKTTKVDVRIISATNKSLKQEIAAGRFREDLFYRLCVVPITLPPLRERINDIPLLAEYFLDRFARDAKSGKAELTPEALNTLLDYHWPGNIRELQNALQLALIKSRGNDIKPEHLPRSIHQPITGQDAGTGKRRRRRKIESTGAIASALSQAQGNKLKAAQLLNISRATLYRCLDKDK